MKTINLSKQPPSRIPVGFLIGIAWAGLASILICGLIAARTPALANRAEVNQVQGILIFTDSKPLQEYIYLGSTKNSRQISLSGQYQPVRDYLIKKIKKEFPAANGAIFHFNNGSADYADAIKLQE